MLAAIMFANSRCAERSVYARGFKIAFGKVIELWLAMPPSALAPKPTSEVVVASLTSFGGYSLYPAAGSVNGMRMCVGVTSAHQRIPG